MATSNHYPLVRYKSKDGSGTCVEIERDKVAWAADTLCEHVVMLPGPVIKGVPTCKSCLAEIARENPRAEIRLEWREGGEE